MINCSYFVDLLFARLRFKDSTDVLKLRGDMYSFLMQQQHAYNCQRLLPVVRKENDLLPKTLVHTFPHHLPAIRHSIHGGLLLLRAFPRHWHGHFVADPYE